MKDLKLNKKISKWLTQLDYEETKPNLVFVNHIWSFMQRMRTGEKLEIEITNDLEEQVPAWAISSARDLIFEILIDINIKIEPDFAEIFLIATHLMLMKRRKEEWTNH